MEHKDINAELLEALEEARNGLAWYQDRFPKATDGSDDEAMARIDAIIAKATSAHEAQQDQTLTEDEEAEFVELVRASFTEQFELIDVPMAVGSRIYDVGTPKQKILDAAKQRCEMLVRTQQAEDAKQGADELRKREWKRIEAPAAASGAGTQDLHAAIMNLPVRDEALPATINERLAYKRGHRDARHAAAEVALAAAPAAESQHLANVRAVCDVLTNPELLAAAPVAPAAARPVAYCRYTDAEMRQMRDDGTLPKAAAWLVYCDGETGVQPQLRQRFDWCEWHSPVWMPLDFRPTAAGATKAQPVRWNATRMDPDTIRLTSSEGETQVFKRPTGDSAPESEHLVWRMACKLVDGPTTGATGEQRAAIDDKGTKQ